MEYILQIYIFAWSVLGVLRYSEEGRYATPRREYSGVLTTKPVGRIPIKMEYVPGFGNQGRHIWSPSTCSCKKIYTQKYLFVLRGTVLRYCVGVH
jgi:hypothetical protein